MSTCLYCGKNIKGDYELCYGCALKKGDRDNERKKNGVSSENALSLEAKYLNKIKTKVALKTKKAISKPFQLHLEI